MSRVDLPLVARARGVRPHLVSRAILEQLADAPDVPTLARDLARAGTPFDALGDAPDIAAFEQAVRRSAGRHLTTLLRWQARRPGAVDVFVAAEDRRSLRALIRGAVQGAPSAARIAGLWPTPTLPERALAELSRQASPSAVVGQLTLLRHPDAPALAPLVRAAHPDLLAVDVALLLGFAARARAAARRGDRVLQDVVAQRIDVGNLETALLLAGGRAAIEPADAFVTGGRWLPVDVFEDAASARSRQLALVDLARTLAGTPLATVLPVVASDVAQVDRIALVELLQRLRRIERLDPLGSASLLVTLLKIEAQCRDLRALAWGAVLGAPTATRAGALVTPWH